MRYAIENIGRQSRKRSQKVRLSDSRCRYWYLIEVLREKDNLFLQVLKKIIILEIFICALLVCE